MSASRQKCVGIATILNPWHKPRMDTILTLTQFTPGEAERITTLTTTMQRDWRRRGHLSDFEGHARFDVFNLAEMWVLKMLADRGIGPQAASDVARICALGISWWALSWVDAYEGDHHRVDECWPAALRKRPKPFPPELIAAMESAEMAGRFKIPSPDDLMWGAKADSLRRQVVLERGFPRVIPAPFFVWWADGSHIWHVSLDEAFGNVSADPRYSGPVIVLDLKALGSTLIDRAGRPFVHVELVAEKNGAAASAGGGVSDQV